MNNWSIEMILTHEFDQPQGVALDTIKVEEILDGVSPANDCALWAAGESLIRTIKRLNLDHKRVQVIRVNVMDTYERGKTT